jgi:hypothetical protein
MVIKIGDKMFSMVAVAAGIGTAPIGPTANTHSPPVVALLSTTGTRTRMTDFIVKRKKLRIGTPHDIVKIDRVAVLLSCHSTG